MESLIILVFVLGYLAITLEHSIKIDKLIPALIMMAFCWAAIAFGIDDFKQWGMFQEVTGPDGNVGSKFQIVTDFFGLTHNAKMHMMEETLLHHLGKTAEILFFLMGAMTIVEIIDYFNGFATIKGFIRTRTKTKLLWIFAFLAFILSAIIDNLTATIVLLTILRKVMDDKTTRLWFAGLIIVAANAGGAWSPIGDVTTTMLWIGNKVTTVNLIKFLLLPSLICMIVPVLIASFLPAFKGQIEPIAPDSAEEKSKIGSRMLYLGLGSIIFVPIFKTVTHLPPYVGMMLSLGIVAIFAEIYSNAKFKLAEIDGTAVVDGHKTSAVHSSLAKIELPSILFFLGILLAVAALESLGQLFGLAEWLKESTPPLGTEMVGAQVSDLVIILLGVGSAVIDNVPLVAASLGMFEQGLDDPIWHFIAYSAGTGGSMLIIGSAAGVVAMGMEKIDFFWYLKKISLLAFIGFIAGAGIFMVMRAFI